MGQHLRIRSCGLALALSLMVAGSSPAYLNNGNWLSTATDNAVPPIGRPITLTWSIVPDGTNVSHLGKPSNLVSVFDSIFPGSVGVALEEKPWFDLVEQCFDRWSVLSGLTLTYEPADDGLTNHAHGVWAGKLGERGDIRLAGATTSSSSTLAEAGFIPNADITFNTTQTAYFSAPGGNFPYINLRTTLMHEIGHSLGFGHSISNNANFLMESFSQTNFDGPQFDDIRGVHYLYGDFNEKSNAGAGNESIATAVPLGPLASGQSVTIGEHAGTGTLVLSSESDFVSIATNDLDFYSFTIDGPSLVELTLSPLGPNDSPIHGRDGVAGHRRRRLFGVEIALRRILRNCEIIFTALPRAAGSQHAILLDLLHLLQLEISTRIVIIRRPLTIAEHLDTARGQHLHGQRSARSGQA
jgi:hypothetical protein